MARRIKPPSSGLQRAILRRSFSVVRRENFYSDLAAFVDAGITPYNAMDRMRDVAKPRRSMRWMVRLLSIVLTKMNDGAGLAAAFQMWIPPEEAALLQAGEKGGRLKESLLELSGLLVNQREVIKSLRSNLIPAFVMMLVLVLLMIYILNTVLKEAKKLVPEEMIDQLMLAPLYFSFGDLFLGSLPYLVVGGIISVAVISASFSRWRPNGIRKWLDHNVPPYSLYTRVQSSFFLITAASMMEAGAPFQQAVEDIQKHARPWTKSHARRMLSKIAAGKAEADAMQTGMLPWDVEDRLAVYKMLDDFKFIMRVTARDSMSVLLKKVNTIGTSINLAVMMTLALFIVFTIFSIGEIALEAESSINKVQSS